MSHSSPGSPTRAVGRQWTGSRLRRSPETARQALRGPGVGTRALDRLTDYPLVIIYNYTDDVVVEVMIDPVRRAVHEVSVARYQPPLTDSEQSEALEMVRDDGRLGEAGIDVDTGVGLMVEDVNFRSPRYGHRLVDLRFGPATRYLPTAFAIVDLATRTSSGPGLSRRRGIMSVSGRVSWPPEAPVWTFLWELWTATPRPSPFGMCTSGGRRSATRQACR